MSPAGESMEKAMQLAARFHPELLSSWQKAADANKSQDILLVLDDISGAGVVTVEVGLREKMLESLTRKGMDLESEACSEMRRPCVGPNAMAKAVWLLVKSRGEFHVTKLVSQTMSRGGQA